MREPARSRDFAKPEVRPRDTKKVEAKQAGNFKNKQVSPPVQQEPETPVDRKDASDVSTKLGLKDTEISDLSQQIQDLQEAHQEELDAARSENASRLEQVENLEKQMQQLEDTRAMMWNLSESR